jgi:hypothetical protein
VPTAIVAALGGAAAIGTAATVAIYAVSLVGTLALSSYQKRKAERTARAQFDAAQVDRLANVPSTVAPRELVLGRVRKGGHVFFKTSVGQFKELFIMCIAVAAHEVDGIEQVYLNAEPVSVDVDGRVTTAPYGVASKISAEQALPGAVTELAHAPVDGAASVRVDRVFLGGAGRTEVTAFTVVGNVVTITEDMASEAGLPPRVYTAYYQYSGFNSFVNIRWHLGAPGQQADAGLVAMLPGLWTPDHRADGIAYLVCQFAYNDGALPSGIPSVTVQMRGAKVLDTRTGPTQFSENPALLMRHVMQHPHFGKRTGFTPQEDTRIIAAANACDTAIDYIPGIVVPMFRASGVFPFGTAARDVLDDLAQAMGGEWAPAAGEFFVRAGVYQLPVMHLTEADLAVVQRGNDGAVAQSPITINPHRPRNDKINTIVPRIWDQAANYVQTTITPLRIATLIADDGAELSQEVVMPAVFYAGQAYHIAGIMLRDGRDPLTVTLPFKFSAYPLELFDGVTLTWPLVGWTAKEFRIVGRAFSRQGAVLLTLKETTAAIFTWGAGFRPDGYASNSGLPKPWDIHPPVMLSISSGEGELVIQSDGTVVNGVRVTWAPIADQSILSGGYVDLDVRVLPDEAWVRYSAPGDATELKFTGVADLSLILLRLRTRNSLTASDWGPFAMHRVIGKTEPPPDMENLAIVGSVLSWSLPRRVPDLAGFIFRFHYGSNLDWGSATPLHDGVITEIPYDLVRRPGGVVTIMGKALDTSGNESLASANIVMNLGDPPIANIVEQWDFAALGWPYAAGEQAGWTLVAGKPTANDLDSFYGTDGQSFYGQDNDPFYKAGAYAQLVYVSSEISLNAALAGSVMTIITETAGIDLKIDYRLCGPGSFYGPDASSFYGDDDAAPFFLPPGEWQPWPGQIVASNDVYQFRIQIGAGVVQGVLQKLVVVVDAPDIEEEIPDLPISAAGTVPPFTKPFTSIKTVQVTLQANGSGATTAEVDKAAPLAPVIKLFNAAHVAVSGATADITLKGY